LDLANILRDERRTSELQPLHHDFYQQAGEYLEGLGRDSSEIADRYSIEAQLIDEEFRGARKSINGLINLRIRKITKKVQLASFSSKEVAIKNMTPQEEQIYSQMLASVIKGKESILALLAPSQTERPLTDKKVMPQEYILVTMKDSVPTFVGVDGKRYTLLGGDLVMLPAVHAKNLCNKNLASKVKQV